MENAGKEFEKDFKKSVPIQAYYNRIKDSTNAWSNTNNDSRIRFTPSNPYDAYIFYSPLFFALELKSTKGTSFSFDSRTPMIKFNQIKGLREASQFNKVIAGFVFNFRNVGRTYFLNIVDFEKFTSSTDKKSINEMDIIKNKGLLIESRTLQIRTKYDIGKFIEHFLEKSDITNEA